LICYAFFFLFFFLVSLQKLNAEVYVETSAHTNSGAALLIDSILDVIARDISTALKTSPKAESARVFQIGLEGLKTKTAVMHPPPKVPVHGMEEDLEVIG
jgi:hypothetical protein